MAKDFANPLSEVIPVSRNTNGTRSRRQVGGDHKRGPRKVVGYSFGEKLKELRKKYRITMRSLSETSGVTIYAICRLENEHDRFPNLLHMVPIILAISKLSGEPLEEIVSQMELPEEKSESFYARLNTLRSLFDNQPRVKGEKEGDALLQALS